MVADPLPLAGEAWLRLERNLGRSGYSCLAGNGWITGVEPATGSRLGCCSIR
jgi:hypothetical protein